MELTAGEGELRSQSSRFTTRVESFSQASLFSNDLKQKNKKQKTKNKKTKKQKNKKTKKQKNRKTKKQKHKNTKTQKHKNKKHKESYLETVFF